MSAVSNCCNNFVVGNLNKGYTWASDQTCLGQVKKLTVAENDSLLAKIGKVFAMIILAVLVFPAALISFCISSIISKLCGNLRAQPQHNIDRQPNTEDTGADAADRAAEAGDAGADEIVAGDAGADAGIGDAGAAAGAPGGAAAGDHAA